MHTLSVKLANEQQERSDLEPLRDAMLVKPMLPSLPFSFKMTTSVHMLLLDLFLSLCLSALRLLPKSRTP